MTDLSVGETIVCRWKDDKTAAYSIGGDDSLRSQLFFAIPEMDRRGIRGTWWVNPGRGGPVNYKQRDDEWAQCWIACTDQWKAAARRGHDFGNHTMRHLGAATYEEAEREIRQAAETIWQANPPQRLQLFLRGGGTTWGISDREIEQILVKYDCVPGRGGGIEDPTWEIDPTLDRLKGYVDAAIQEGSWHLVGFHGIGPDCEWGGPVDGTAFTGMLDYLVEVRDLVWAGTHTEVHKYDQERRSASVSLRTGVDPAWERVLVSQGGATSRVPVSSGVAQFSAYPNRGEISLRSR